MTIKVIKKGYLIFLMFVGGMLSTANAQFGNVDTVVQVSAVDSVNANNVIVTIELEAEKDWMVYDSIAGEDGPIPISISPVLSENLVLSSVKKPKLKDKLDDIFEVQIFYFEGKVSYQLLFSKVDASKGYSLNLELTYMACNLASGVCMPPETVPFTFVKN